MQGTHTAFHETALPAPRCPIPELRVIFFPQCPSAPLALGVFTVCLSRCCASPEGRGDVIRSYFQCQESLAWSGFL